MKKFAYFLTVLMTLVVLTTSCGEKEDEDVKPTIQTLEQKYPDWKNLTWVSTAESNNFVNYPRFEVSISENVITLKQWKLDGSLFTYTYNGIEFVGNNVTLNNGSAPDITFAYTVNTTNKTVTLTKSPYTYLLQIK